MKLSAVIITFNEERNIERCLRSLETIADEIIILDSFSTDGTEEICKRFKRLQFFQQTFSGHIEQKNAALDMASNDFVISIDADEVISEALAAEIMKIKLNPACDGYSMNRLNNYCGKWIRHGSWYPDRKLRLFNRKKARWTGINPHDKAELTAGSTVQHIKADLLHYSYQSVSEHSTKLNYFSDLAAGAYLKQGKSASISTLLINPSFAFFRDYILRRGFLDGYYGWVIASFTAYYTLQKYVKLKFLIDQQKSARAEF